jgi:hypothetical protein
MIYITQGVDSKVCLTLAESSLLAAPHYLFALYRDIDLDEPVICVHYTDISTYPNTYNLFTFNETIASGEYTYRVYESADPLPEDIADTTGRILEEGLMIVYSSTNVDTSVYL